MWPALELALTLDTQMYILNVKYANEVTHDLDHNYTKYRRLLSLCRNSMDDGVAFLTPRVALRVRTMSFNSVQLYVTQYSAGSC